MFDHARVGRRGFAALSSVIAALLAAALTTIPGTSATAATRHPQVHHTLAYQDAGLPVADRVADLLGRMTLEEKVGQMTQAERGDVAGDPSLVTTWGLGSVLSGGGSVPADNTPAGWADMVDTFQQAALNTRLGIPILYGVDSVHGHGNLNGATVFPHNIGLGATRDPKLVQKIGAITAEETRASGPQWSFAPCICVARDDRWGRIYESFGESPALVASMETVIDGLQGAPGELADPDHVLATAKHFAGDGLTAYDDSLAGTGAYPIDQGVDKVDRATFDELAVAPYWPAVGQHHVGAVMPSFSSVDWTEDGLGNPVKMHANRELITDVLKGAIGFHGFVISDWQGIRQIPGDYRTQVATGVNAGIDMFMEPYSGSPTGAPDFIAALVSLVQDGTVPVSRIDDAVSRILTAKFELGLFEHPFTDRSHLDDIGSPAHRAVARRAVQESQVLLENDGNTLPLKPGHPVYVAGSNADNIGNQAGGWTLTWQGGSTNVIPGQTVLDGIEHAAHNVTFSQDASAPVPAGAQGIVVVGETPYAEGFGDVGGPLWAWDPGDGGTPRPAKTMELSDDDKAAIATVCAAAASCTVVVVSGRPIVIDPALLAQIDSLVASWLPGSEGEGVADVLFGKAAFTGRLSVSWPRSVSQEPINVGDASYDPLYPYGWGLQTGHR